MGLCNILLPLTCQAVGLPPCTLFISADGKDLVWNKFNMFLLHFTFILPLIDTLQVENQCKCTFLHRNTYHLNEPPILLLSPVHRAMVMDERFKIRTLSNSRSSACAGCRTSTMLLYNVIANVNGLVSPHAPAKFKRTANQVKTFDQLADTES